MDKIDQSKLRGILDIAWGGALDITTSKDFRNDKGELDEGTYVRVKGRIFDEAISQIMALFSEALKEAERAGGRKELNNLPHGDLTERMEDYVQSRLAALQPKTGEDS